MQLPILTVGHSNRTLTAFIDLLREHAVELVVDVRRLPGSARYPQFDEDALSASLGELGIGLRHAAGLTGRRPRSTEVPPETNAWWQHRSFHNYADYALSDEFGGALAQLREWAATARTVLMCSEAVWWRCHRRIIADHLLARGDAVTHILAPGRAAAARLSDGAAVGTDGRVTYPADIDDRAGSGDRPGPVTR